MEPQHATGLFQFHDKIQTDEVLLLENGQRWVKRDRADAGEDGGNFVEVTTENLENS